MHSEFQKRLKETRAARGFSQSDLAKKTGLQPAAISHFETGQRSPSFDNLRKLADALEISVDYLLGRIQSSVSCPAEQIDANNKAKAEIALLKSLVEIALLRSLVDELATALGRRGIFPPHTKDDIAILDRATELIRP